MFRSLLMAVLLSVSGVLSAFAEGSGTKDDPYVLEDGATYTLEEFKSFYGVFTAPDDGILTVACRDAPTVYTDATFATPAETQFTFGGNYDNNTCTLKCTGGTKYYLGYSFIMNGGTLSLTFGSEAASIELTGVSPEEGSVFDISYGQLDLTFNQNVTVGSGTMTAGGTTEALAVNTHGAYVSVSVGQKLMELYGNSSIKEDDDIKFTFSGVAPTADPTALYNGTGELTLTYKAGPEPLTLVSSTNTPSSDKPVTTFYSYYMKNNGSGDGIVTLTFSGELNLEEGNKPVARLCFGNQEAGEYYEEELPVNMLGNSMLMINLKGKLRRSADMLPSVTTAYETITLKVTNVLDKAGNHAYSGVQGLMGSYYFLYDFKEVDYRCATEWNALGGSSTATIDDKTTAVELYMRESGGEVAFTGVEFAYIENGEQKTRNLTLSEIDITSEDANEKTLTIPVPNISADQGTDITVSLTGVERPDGLTSENAPTASDVLKATFATTGRTAAPFAIVSAIWHNGTEDVEMSGASIGVLTSGTTSTITTNSDSETGYAEWELRSAPESGNEFVRMGYLSDGTIEWYGEKLEAGKDYVFTLKAWKSEADRNGGAEPNVGVASFTIHGNASVYVYSDVVMLTDISNTIELLSADDNNRTFEFSAPVTLTAVVNMGYGTSKDCTVESASADGTAWKVTFPDGVLNSYPSFDVNLFAKDAAGKAVNTTQNGLGTVMGNEENTWFEVHFRAPYNLPEVTVTPADGSKTDAIGTVTFGYAGGVDINWGATSEPVTIYNKETNETVATFTQDDLVADDEEIGPFDPIPSYHITLGTPVTTSGTYVVEVPEGFFILGESMPNRKTTVTYTVTGAYTSIDGIAAGAEKKVSIYTAGGMLLFGNADAATVKGLAKGLYIIDGRKVVVR